MHARHNDIELLKEFRVLIQIAVVEDVDLDSGENAHGRHLLSHTVDHRQLGAQPVGRQPVSDPKAGRMVSERTVFVPERLGGTHHFLDGHRAI
ncbi:Uncharacterised protein [Mycobacteroides abscessus subsp. massiliense]|nr:Uncharacterised protein [Mycobacteroides abscessus subsp. massiliense]